MSPNSSTTESLTISKIPQLADDATNWVMYSMRLPIYVTSKAGYKKHLDSWMMRPIAFKVVADSSGKLQVVLNNGATAATQANIDAQEKLMDEWDIYKAAIKQIIFSSISNRHLMDIQELDTAHNMWKQLCEIHQDKPDLSAVAKWTQLNNMQCTKGGDVHAHLGMMQKIRLELVGMKHPVNKTNYMSMLQQSMPSSYYNFMSALLASAWIMKTKINPDEMVNHLTTEYNIWEALNTKLQKMVKLGGSALVITSEGQRNGKSNKGSGCKKSKNESGTICGNCGKPNYMEADCWWEGGGKEGQGPWQQKKKQKEKEQNTVMNHLHQPVSFPTTMLSAPLTSLILLQNSNSLQNINRAPSLTVVLPLISPLFMTIS